MCARPYESSVSGFSLPGHKALECSNLESAERIASHFATISQEYLPVTLSSLPPNVVCSLASADSYAVPVLCPSDVQSRIVKAKKPRGLVDEDLPKKILQKCPDLLSIPATMIFNSITKSGIYPSKWKIEEQIAIPKINPPENVDDLRNIAKTPFLSKIYESF